MREIKFRGKRLKDGEWVFGLLMKDVYGHHRIQFDPKNFSVVVDPATVGQFTGLLDMDGKEIYEGDICTHGKDIGEIVWLGVYAAFGLRTYTDDGRPSIDTYPVPMYYDPEVIGNIHDNPDLLTK